jgi:hypothetical protein
MSLLVDVILLMSAIMSLPSHIYTVSRHITVLLLATIIGNLVNTVDDHVIASGHYVRNAGHYVTIQLRHYCDLYVSTTGHYVISVATSSGHHGTNEGQPSCWSFLLHQMGLPDILPSLTLWLTE